MTYTIEFLGENGDLIKRKPHKGSAESASKTARNELFDNQADRARILDEAGKEIELIRVDA